MVKEQKFSMMKQALAGAQKTLLSSIDEFLNANELIMHDEDFTGKIPSLIVVFGTSLAAAKDAGEYLKNYRERKGYLPKILCLPGISFGRCVRLGQPVEDWLKSILMEMGVPEEQFCKTSFDFSKTTPVEALAEVMRKGHFKYVGVFSSRGYSVSTAIELKEKIPGGCFKFYCNPYIPQESWCLDSEDYVDGYGIDFILGEIIRLNMRRDTLPEYIQDHLMRLDVAIKYVKKGLVLGIQNCKEREAVGLTEEEYKSLLEKRVLDFPWMTNPRKAFQRTKQQIELLLSR